MQLFPNDDERREFALGRALLNRDTLARTRNVSVRGRTEPSGAALRAPGRAPQLGSAPAACAIEHDPALLPEALEALAQQQAKLRAMLEADLFPACLP
jgi:hypothetical protein